MKAVYIYGLGGAEKQYKVLHYKFLVDEDISIRNIIYEATMMKVRNPSIEKVYAIDNRHGLKRDYQESYRKNTIESCAIFKDILEREGLEIDV